ncbi:putative disease resistance protein RGA3 [Salvia divinorum]|uniref:Disease resistance protein RGA3 n=1 Tax=Salvia divinorum TaxID=28513 RepID=A0ABD1FUD6_SALDI
MDGGAAAIEVLVQNLINALREDYSLLRDAVKIWLRELEALAFDADNVLDEFSYHLLHKEVKKMKTPKAKDKVQFG